MVYHGARKEPGNGAPGPVAIKATGLGGDGEAVKMAAAKEGVTLEHTSYDGWLELGHSPHWVRHMNQIADDRSDSKAPAHGP